MAAKLEAKSKERKNDAINLLILLFIASLLGVYLITTTVLIAKDGVYYIERAQKFSSDPIGIIKAHPPGYPFLIFIAHKFVGLFSNSSSAQTWIYSAQSITFLCRLVALIPLYFIGRLLIGSKKSFWAILILIMLPYPAEFGGDVIREWPHILFLSTGLLFLIWGSRFGKWWMFAIAGLVGGLGHTIRPECAQIVLYGMLWAAITLFHQRRNVGRLKTICLTTILMVGFAIPTAPYMKIRDQIVPPQLRNIFTFNTVYLPDTTIDVEFVRTKPAYMASGISIDILKSLGKLLSRLSENLIYFFVLPLIAGLYCHFRRMRNILLTESFFIFALIVLYIVMMVLLHINCGYISRRHCMPIIVFTVFYIPVGLQILARSLSKRSSKNGLVVKKNRRRWFFILMAVGLIICAAKFARITPLRLEKQGYKEAAEWLRENTVPKDIIAVSDRRIYFYAERKGLTYDKNIPKQAKYVVRIVKNGSEEPKFGRTVKEQYSVWADKRKKSGKRLVIYKMH